MKKIILGTLALGMCLTLTACGTQAKTDATISALSNQLDHTANIVSSVQTVSPTQITAENMNEYASSNANNAQNNLTDEEFYKLDILNKTAIIKNHLSDLKLSKAQKCAVRDLTDDLTKYTNSVANSKSELSGTLKSIESLKKNYSKNEERINAKLNRIASNSNARLSYYQNILNTLDQLQQYVKTDNNTQNPSNLGIKIADIKDLETQDDNQSTQTEQNKNDEKNSKTTLQKNIDTYLPETKCPDCGEKVNGKVCPKCGKEIVVPSRIQKSNPINNNPVAPINNMPMNYGGNYYNNPANPYRFNSNNINHAAYPYNGNYGYYGGTNYGMNGFYNNRYYNNGYYNGGAFNPNRNTDTYAPYMRNIDTYKGFGYGENINNTTFVNENLDNKEQEKDTKSEDTITETNTLEETSNIENRSNKITAENITRDATNETATKENVTKEVSASEMETPAQNTEDKPNTKNFKLKSSRRIRTDSPDTEHAKAHNNAERIETNKNEGKFEKNTNNNNERISTRKTNIEEKQA